MAATGYNDFPNAIVILSLPDLCCYPSFLDFLLALPSFLGVELPTSITNVIFSVIPPSDTQRNFLWIVFDNTGAAVDVRVFSQGGWVSISSIFKLQNDQWLKARNFADNSDINIFKLNANDELEFAQNIYGTLSSYVGLTTGAGETYIGCPPIIGGCPLKYTDGMHFSFTAHHSNAVTNPQFDAGPGLRTIIGQDGGAISINDIVQTGLFELEYRASSDSFILLNPANGWFVYTSDFTQIGTMGFIPLLGLTSTKARISGKTMDVEVRAFGTTTGVAMPYIQYSVPREMVVQEIGGFARTSGVSTYRPALTFFNGPNTLGVAQVGGVNWGIGSFQAFFSQARVEIV